MTRSPCLAKAVELLARRAHFRRELEAKLIARGFSEVETARALDRLAEQGWVDDRATARDWVAGRLARGDFGRRRLLAELERKGVDGDLAAEVLAELTPEDDLEPAREAAERWLRQRGARAPRPEALARHLERKGFSSRAILNVLEEFPTDHEE